MYQVLGGDSPWFPSTVAQQDTNACQADPTDVHGRKPSWIFFSEGIPKTSPTTVSSRESKSQQEAELHTLTWAKKA